MVPSGGCGSPSRSLTPCFPTHSCRLLLLQADATPVGGLATWLRMSAHLTRPDDVPADQPSPVSGDSSPEVEGRAVSAVLDFSPLEQKDSKPSAPPAAPTVVGPAAPAAAVAPRQVAQRAKDVPAPAAVVPVAVPAAESVAAPAVAPAAASTAARRPAANGGRSVLRAMLALFLLAALLLGGPVALHVYAPALSHRYLPAAGEWKLWGLQVAAKVPLHYWIATAEDHHLSMLLLGCTCTPSFLPPCRIVCHSLHLPQLYV